MKYQNKLRKLHQFWGPTTGLFRFVSYVMWHPTAWWIYTCVSEEPAAFNYFICPDEGDSKFL